MASYGHHFPSESKEIKVLELICGVEFAFGGCLWDLDACEGGLNEPNQRESRNVSSGRI